eukprot:g5716.t1
MLSRSISCRIFLLQTDRGSRVRTHSHPFRRLGPKSSVRWLINAKGDEEETNEETVDVIAGYNIEEETILDSPLFANALKVGLSALFFGFVFLLYILAKPLIDNTINAFPSA